MVEKMFLRENERVLKLKGRLLEEEEGKRFILDFFFLLRRGVSHCSLAIMIFILENEFSKKYVRI